MIKIYMMRSCRNAKKPFREEPQRHRHHVAATAGDGGSSTGYTMVGKQFDDEDDDDDDDRGDRDERGPVTGMVIEDHSMGSARAGSSSTDSNSNSNSCLGGFGFIESLEEGVLDVVLSHLRADDLAAFAATSRGMRALINVRR